MTGQGCGRQCSSRDALCDAPIVLILLHGIILLKALKSFNVKGALVCESPNIETDAQLLKSYYLSI